MITEQRERPHEQVTYWQERVQAARQGGDPRPLAAALAHWGLALFEAGSLEAGAQAFDEAQALARELDDVRLQIRGLSIKALAFQQIERFHKAYETVEEIVSLAAPLDDPAITCDALVTQAQILIQSGEPLIALDKLGHARRLAVTLGDKRRQMFVAAVLGNAHIAAAALDEATAYIQSAGDLARDLDDPVAEAEQRINLGVVLKWQDRYGEAIEAFNRALALNEAHPLPHLELTALRYLTECYANLNDPDAVIAHAERRAALARAHDDSEAAFSLLEALTLAAYRKQDLALAHRALTDAIELARALPDPDKEVDLLVSLGESYLAVGQFERALEVYRQALEGARRLSRAKDEAYLVGRLGVVYGEQGRTDEALHYHGEALELARQGGFAALEGEQLCMMALAYHEQGAVETAVRCCTQAIDVYARAGDGAAVQRARDLLASMNGTVQGDDLDDLDD